MLQQFTVSHCVAVVRSVLDDIDSGLTQDASAKLLKLKEDSEQLATKTEQFAKRLERVEQCYINRAEDIQREIGALGCKEDDLAQKMRSEKADLESNRKVLQDNESRLKSAESNVREAEQKLE